MHLIVILALFTLNTNAIPLRPVPDQYIITFTPDVARSNNAELPHYRWLQSRIDTINSNLRSSKKFSIIHKYSIGRGYKGYAAFLPPNIVSAIRDMPNIAYVEQDRLASINYVEPSASWGLARISQRILPLSRNHTFPDKAGQGVRVYVIDTGINIDHPEFQGRADFGVSFTDDGDADGNGHGTHCAGTIASKSFGVAKKSNVVAVKVLNAKGSGEFSSIIAGINWVVGNATNELFGIKSVASMSLGGGKTQAINDAVSAAVRSGIPFIVAAGNEKQNACNVSPAGEPLAFTVAASEETDVLATYSNYGSCVDIIAPGSKITSTWLGSSTNTISGTSMAAPHVAGVFALVLSELNVRSADEAYNIVSAMTTQDQIKNLPPRTINSLLFNGIDRFVTTLSVRLVEEEESMEIV